jgi:protocatechuate 3,4-dioxygenase beta subunit
MRTIPLIAVICLSFAALAALWLGLRTSGNDVRAQNHADASDDPSSSAALDAENAAASAAARDGGREAIHVGPSLEEIAQAEALRKLRESKLVEGRVVGPDGAGGVRGIPGATVWASAGQNDWMQLPLDIETDGLPARWIQLQKVETDADGHFGFKGLKPGPLRLAARASGFAPAYLDHLDLPQYEHHVLGDVKLESGVTVKGRVIGNDGDGLAGVKVLIALDCVHRANLIALPGRGIPAGTTGADGAFVVDQLASGPWHLLFEAPGYVLAERDGRIERAGQSESGVVVRLEKGLDISGKVVCKDAEIPKGLRIGARLVPPPKEQHDPANAPNEDDDAPNIPKDDVRSRYGTVEDDGTFVITGLKAWSSYRLIASRKTEDASGWKAFPAVEPQNVPAGSRGIELVYKPESALIFRVVDDASGLPIQDMIVAAGVGRERALRDDKGEVVHEFVDGKVRYPEMHVPTAGGKAVVLRVSANGYKDHENKNVGLRAGQELDLGEIRLLPEHVVVVTVTDAVDAKPIEGARVLLSAQKNDEELKELADNPPDQTLLGDIAWKVAVTGADGKARITSIPGKSVGLIASAKDHRPSKVEHALLPDDTDPTFTLELGHGGTVVAKVTDNAGHPIAGVGVEHRLPRRTADDENVEAPRKTNAEGIVRFEALIDGVHAFRVHEEEGEVYFWGNNDESQDHSPRWVDVGVAEGQSADVEFTAPPRGDVHGIVREGGRPVEGAHIKFVPRKEGEGHEGMAYWGGASDPFSTVTNGDGEYKLEHLCCGEYSAMVMTAGRRMGAEFRVRVTQDESEHDFDLDVSGIEGTVLDERGTPMAGIQVNCWRVNGGLNVESPYHMVVTEDDRGNARVDWQQISSSRLVTDQNGHYLLSGLVSDEPVTVYVEGEWVEHASSPPITLSPGETRHGVDFALHLAGKVEVTLGATATRRQEWYMARLSKGEDDKVQVIGQTWIGSWQKTNTIPSVLPGHYKIALRRYGDDNAPPLSEAEVDVAIGQVAHVTLDPH